MASKKRNANFSYDARDWGRLSKHVETMPSQGRLDLFVIRAMCTNIQTMFMKQLRTLLSRTETNIRTRIGLDYDLVELNLNGSKIKNKMDTCYMNKTIGII